MNLLSDLLLIINRELNLQGKTLNFTAETKLAGALPQLDSMANVNVAAPFSRPSERFWRVFEVCFRLNSDH